MTYLSQELDKIAAEIHALKSHIPKQNLRAMRDVIGIVKSLGKTPPTRPPEKPFPMPTEF